MRESKAFRLFQEEFGRYQKLFQLDSYIICFEYEPLDETVFSNITINQESMVATVRFNSKLARHLKSHRNLRYAAKHEAIHLLLGRLGDYGRSRYTTEQDMCEATEELNNKLMFLVKEE